MKRMTVYAPEGMLGYGFPATSLEEAMKHEPQVIAVDAGSTDPGPYYLGAGTAFVSREMVKRDLSLILPAARKQGVPFIVGSAGGAGGEPHLQWTLDIVKEVAKENNLHFRMAIIHGEIEKAYVRRKLAEGRILSYESGKPLTEKDVKDSIRIVGQMGVEPLIHALEAGAEVIVAGRAYDACLIAAFPIMHGFDEGLAMHMGKILECGALIAVPRESDGALGIIAEDHFLIFPADINKTTNVGLVSAHTLYEKSNPVTLGAPGGAIELQKTTFEQHDNRTVKVSGSKFNRIKPYTVKLEGVKKVGYRNVCIAGTHDPLMIKHMDEVIDFVKKKLKRDLAGRISEDDYQVIFHLYGKDGVMGALEPQKEVTSHELGIIIETVAKTQAMANTVAALARSASLHCQYEGRVATGGNLALMFSPAEFPAPEVYEFNVYHLMQVDDPCEPFPMKMVEV